MGRYQPGQSGNLKGRPPGSKNKSAEEFRAMIKAFVSDNWEGLQKDFDAMKPAERAMFREKLLKYILPEAMSPERLTVAQLEQLLEYIKTEYNEQKQTFTRN